MNKYIVILIVLFFLSCSTERNVKSQNNSKLVIKIGDEILILDKDNSTFSLNENCNSIHTGASYNQGNYVNRFLTEFWLTKYGTIVNVKFVDYLDNAKIYNSIDFKPKETFLIKNFSNLNGTISFDFEGDLYEVGNHNNVLTIIGSINHEETVDIDCSYYPSTLQTEIEGNQIIFTKRRVNSTGTNYEYIFLSDDGFKLSLFSDNEVKNFDEGVYGFDENTNIRINLEKYIGINKASVYPQFNPSEWINYACTGTLNISEQVNNSDQYTDGSFNVIAKDANGEIVYQLTNGIFKI